MKKILTPKIIAYAVTTLVCLLIISCGIFFSVQNCKNKYSDFGSDKHDLASMLNRTYEEVIAIFGETDQYYNEEMSSHAISVFYVVDVLPNGDKVKALCQFVAKENQDISKAKLQSIHWCISKTEKME